MLGQPLNTVAPLSLLLAPDCRLRLPASFSVRQDTPGDTHIRKQPLIQAEPVYQICCRTYCQWKPRKEEKITSHQCRSNFSDRSGGLGVAEDHHPPQACAQAQLSFFFLSEPPQHAVYIIGRNCSCKGG